MIYLPGNEADCTVNLKEKETHLYPQTVPRNRPLKI